MKSRAKWGQRGEGYVALQLLLFGVIFFAPLLLPELVEWPRPWNLIGLGLGLVLAITGGILAVAGVLSLGRNLAAVPYPKDDAVLVERGAFKIVRHPIYAGIILGAFGWAFLNNSLITLLLALLLFVFFDIKSRREEKWLSEKYSDYKDYQARVRKLIPLIY